MRDGNFNRVLRMNHDCILPEGNLCPPSLYIMRKVLGILDAADFQYHVCVKDCHSWDHTPKASWKAHAGDQCPECGAQRFKEKRGGGVAPRRAAAGL